MGKEKLVVIGKERWVEKNTIKRGVGDIP